MEIELLEIRDFIVQHYPFSALPEGELDELIPKIQIGYIRRGQAFPPPQSDGYFFYFIRSGAIEYKNSKDELLGQLAEGDFTADACDLIDIDPDSKGMTIEDTLIYKLPCETLKFLIANHPVFEQYFGESMRKRLQSAIRAASQKIDYSMASMTIHTSELLNKPPVMLPEGTSIQDAAKCMSDQNVSSLMLTDAQGKLSGLITDRDLRRRCVAQGVDPQFPASQIMSTDISTIAHDSLLLDAVMAMARHDIHHLPVLQGDNIIGLLTTTDVTRHHNNNPVFIASEIRKATSVEAMAQACQQLPTLQLTLANASVTAHHIGEIISGITDALTIQLLTMATANLGPPPVPFAWIAGGSQARQEQTAHSDQDHALILADSMQPEHDDYFLQLAKYVCDGLNTCGFPYCPGDAMASNIQWRQPLGVWKQYFSDWIARPDPEALMHASIFFDQRVIYGDEALHQELYSYILEKTKSSKLFIAHMAANALQYKPPLGFFRKLVLVHDGKHDATFNIKHRGIAPITNIARIVALAEGVSAVNSTERLQAASNTPSLSTGMSDNLCDALEYISSLRIHHQADQARNNLPVDNFSVPDKLSELERKHLKDCFSVIKDMQDSLEYTYSTGRLG